jgi:hypothetical protein
VIAGLRQRPAGCVRLVVPPVATTSVRCASAAGPERGPVLPDLIGKRRRQRHVAEVRGCRCAGLERPSEEIERGSRSRARRRLVHQDENRGRDRIGLLRRNVGQQQVEVGLRTPVRSRGGSLKCRRLRPHESTGPILEQCIAQPQLPGLRVLDVADRVPDPPDLPTRRWVLRTRCLAPTMYGSPATIWRGSDRQRSNRRR